LVALGFAHITGYDMRMAQDLAAVSLLLLEHVLDASIRSGRRQALQQTRLRENTPTSPGHFVVRCQSNFSTTWCPLCTAHLMQTYNYQKCMDNLGILQINSFRRRIVIWKLELMMHKKETAGCLEHCARGCVCGQQLELLAANPRGCRLKRVLIESDMSSSAAAVWGG